FGVCERYATVVAARDDQRGLADRGRQVGAGPQVVEEARPERIDPSSARDVSCSAVVSAATTRRVGSADRPRSRRGPAREGTVGRCGPGVGSNGAKSKGIYRL